MLELQNISYNVDDEGKDKGILKNVSLKLDDDKFYAKNILINYMLFLIKFAPKLLILNLY